MQHNIGLLALREFKKKRIFFLQETYTVSWLLVRKQTTQFSCTANKHIRNPADGANATIKPHHNNTQP